MFSCELLIIVLCEPNPKIPATQNKIMWNETQISKIQIHMSIYQIQSLCIKTQISEIQIQMSIHQSQNSHIKPKLCKTKLKTMTTKTKSQFIKVKLHASKPNHVKWNPNRWHPNPNLHPSKSKFVCFVISIFNFVSVLFLFISVQNDLLTLEKTFDLVSEKFSC